MKNYTNRSNAIQKILAGLPAGSPLHIGFDVHARTWSYTVLSDAGECVVSRRVSAGRSQLEALAQSLNGFDIRAVYEAGPTGTQLLQWMRELGWTAMIVPPSAVRKSTRDLQVKTDRLDSRLLAEELRAGQLWSIGELPEDQIKDRQLLRTTEQLGRDREDLARRIKSLCLLHSLPAPWHERAVRGALTKADLAWARSFDTGSPALTAALRALLQRHDALVEQVEQLWQMLETLVSTKRPDEWARLTSVKGVARKTAVTWLLELPPLDAFANADAFVSWLGLANSERSSGEKVRRGRISKSGNRALRRILVHAAENVRRHDPGLQAFSRRLRPRLHPNQVKVAVAAKLARRLFKVMKEGVAWSPPESQIAA